MTTALDVLDFPQPFGVPMTTTATGRNLTIDPKHQNYSGLNANVRVALPEGVSIVQAMYSGPEAAELSFSPGSGIRRITLISEKTGGGAIQRPSHRLCSRWQRLLTPHSGNPTSGRTRRRNLSHALRTPLTSRRAVV